MSKPFNVFADSSDYCVGGILTQTSMEGHEKPVAFASSKLTVTQQRWAIVEKEAYACLWALQKFKHWIFGSRVTLYSYHNPLTLLTDTSPKSAKLMQWALSLQQFDIIFKFRAGCLMEAAVCLSRMVEDQSVTDYTVCLTVGACWFFC
jgi:hypothetical protein